jgi:hypothetical protein
MKANFEKALAYVLEHEGYVDFALVCPRTI